MRDTKVLAAVAAAAVAVAVGAAVPAAAAGTDQVVGIEQVVSEPDGTDIAYTVSKIVPSADPVGYPVAGQLYEATVMARATRGTVMPLVPSFTARVEGGATYPALVGVSSLSQAPLQEGATTDGKIYFDVGGPVPDKIVYDDPSAGVLTWGQPVAGEPATGGSAGGGSTGGAGGSRGVTGSTGPNDVAPSVSGGEIGGTGAGTEGGGGNLGSGGGSGAPNGDTGGNTGSGGGGSTGGIGGGGGTVGVGGGG